MKNPIIIFALLTLFQISNAQKKVSISIDDVPNTIRYKTDNYHSLLLEKLDSLSIPISIFINEGNIYKGDAIHKNFELLNRWAKQDYVTLGNHSFHHYRYSTVGLDSFKQDILKGEAMTIKLAKKYNKTLKHFRFPYNDMGKDTLQHTQIKDFLKKEAYQVTPFTIESSDWMYNRVYEYYLNNNKQLKAKVIGEQYVSKTLEYFDFFEIFCEEQYGRTINHIYLCHDNKLNTDFLDQIIYRLKERNYQFISLDEALKDQVYYQKNQYYKKWGVSWLYRWQNSHKERLKYMKQEPSTIEIENLLKQINTEKSKSY